MKFYLIAYILLFAKFFCVKVCKAQYLPFSVNILSLADSVDTYSLQ